MNHTKRRWTSSLAFRGTVVALLSILLIIGLTAAAHLFTSYEVRLFSTSEGLRLELDPRTRAEDVLQAPPQTETPSPSPLPEGEETPSLPSEHENNPPSMPAASLGSGATLELHPVPDYDETGSSPRLSFQEIYRKYSPSVVLIDIHSRFGIEGGGTGVIMAENGYIITNAHVVEGARQVTVTLYDGSVFPAVVVGKDENTDIAVLKIDAEGLTPAVFGDSGQLQVGQEVAVIGNPLGHAHTMTTGIISALDRDILSPDGIPMRLIQTNAAVNPGNSGGPLFNIYGQVVGIVTMKLVGDPFSPLIEGMGFAVPTVQIKPVVDSLIEHGRVVGRPALGITVLTITPHEAAAEGLAPGVYVQRVLEDTDAHAQGLREGDRITAVNGISITDSADLRDEILTHRAGDTVTLTIERDGREQELEIQLMDAGLLEF